MQKALAVVALLVGCGQSDGGAPDGDASTDGTIGADALPDALSDGPGILDVEVRPGAKPPIVDAGADVTITLPIDRVTLPGKATDDGKVVGWQWTKVSGPTTVLRDDRTATLVATMLIPGDYVFQLAAQDEDGAVGTDTVSVSVKPLATVPDTVMEHISARPGPVFKKGHGLPPLVFGGYPDFDFNKLMAEKYLYALHLGSAVKYWADQVGKPGTEPTKKLDLRLADKERYRVSIAVDRPLSWADHSSDHCGNEQALRAKSPLVALAKKDGTIWEEGKDKAGNSCFAFSPLGPPTVHATTGTETGKQLKPFVDYLRAKGGSVDVIHNYGEYALGVPIVGPADWTDVFNMTRRFWDDANVAKAWGPMPTNGHLLLEKAFTEISLAKGAQEGAVTQEIYTQSGLGPETRYLYFTTRAAAFTGRWGEWRQSAWDYALLAKGKPSRSPENVAVGQMYYFDADGFGDLGVPGALPGCRDTPRGVDAMTAMLNEKAWELKAGSPLAFPWVSSACITSTGGFVYAPRDRMMGFLKTWYATGNISATVFHLSLGLIQKASVTAKGAASFPRWLEVYVDLGEVHALFSHLEDDLRNGDLMPGDGKQTMVKQVPAVLDGYELYARAPGTTTRDPQVRVVGRKHKTVGGRVLVAGFVAAGADREVEVTVDGAKVKLAMRGAGSVYVIDKGVPKLLDLDPMRPTGHMLESD